MKYIVYLTTNLKSKVNNINRIYVGVHKTKNPDIFDGYLGCGVKINKPSTYMCPRTPFLYAVKKYGVDSFKRTTLFIYDTVEEAFLKEAEIVNIEFINQSHTYNVALGGVGGSLYEQDPKWHSKPIYQFTLSGELINSWETSVDAADFYGYSVRRFTDAALNHTEFLDFFWSREKYIDIKTYTKGKKQFTYLYNIDGKFLLEFTSRTECSKYLNCLPLSVSNALRNAKPIKGYYVSDKIVDLFVSRPRKSLQNETIYLYNINGEFIGKYKGSEIFSIVNEHSFSKLNSAFNDNNGWYKDYYISLTKIVEIPKKINNGKKKIEVYAKDGNLIEILDTVKETKEKYNINAPTMNKLLKGIKSHNQYIFKYSK